MKSAFLPLAAAALSLSACADYAGQEALEAKYAMIGMPKAELFACAGAPERQAVADGKEFYTYTVHLVERGATTTMGGGWGYGGGGWGGGYVGVPLYDYGGYSRTCAATFVVERGRVSQVIYGGDAAGGRRPGLCRPVIGDCLDAARRLRGVQ